MKTFHDAARAQRNERKRRFAEVQWVANEAKCARLSAALMRRNANAVAHRRTATSSKIGNTVARPRAR